ncbi:hypothetical protein HOD75_02585 [archaeon]|jgi:hypothetical protein|nr:hypothetical protein [archaeon]MBT4241764.1 hypothetical protein [archaeon]MBT4418312.1 hypothetical protein [archaeon]
MKRVKFKKGEQKGFLDLVVSRLNCISVRGILQFGFEMKYSSLKNYYCERRVIPLDFFNDLCHLAKVDAEDLDVEYLEGNWGQIKGGKKGRK